MNTNRKQVSHGIIQPTWSLTTSLYLTEYEVQCGKLRWRKCDVNTDDAVGFLLWRNSVGQKWWAKPDKNPDDIYFIVSIETSTLQKMRRYQKLLYQSNKLYPNDEFNPTFWVQTSKLIGWKKEKKLNVEAKGVWSFREIVFEFTILYLTSNIFFSFP